MNYAEFRNKVKNYPFFRSNIFPHLTDNVSVLRRQVSEWVDKGYIIQLKRGMYTLCNEDRVKGFSNYFLANNLYTPSYVSLESAMSYYGFIPELVPATTSISSKKTQRFANNFGSFIYHHVAAKLFGGFVLKKDEYGNGFFIATPERALVDFLYFKTRGMVKIEEDILDVSFRLQNLELLNKPKLKETALQFKQKKLNQLINWVINSIGKYYV